jgi:hypothetical protein
MFGFGLVWFGPGLILLKTWSTLGLERLVCESVVFPAWIVMDCGIRCILYFFYFVQYTYMCCINIMPMPMGRVEFEFECREW